MGCAGSENALKIGEGRPKIVTDYAKKLFWKIGEYAEFVDGAFSVGR